MYVFRIQLYDRRLERKLDYIPDRRRDRTAYKNKCPGGIAMKTQRVVLNIVFICIIAVFVCVIAVGTVFRARFKLPLGAFGPRINYVSGFSGVAAFNADFDAGDISFIQLNFADENIAVEPSWNDTVSIELSSPFNLTDTDKMRYKLENGALYAESGHMGQNWSGCFGMFNFMPTDITVRVKIPQERTFNASLNTISGSITVPQQQFGEFSCSSVSGSVAASGDSALNATLSSTSGYVTVDNINCEALKVSTVSGIVKITGDTGKLDLNSTSGSVVFAGSANTATATTVSGDINLEFAKPVDIEAGSTSGNVEVSCQSMVILNKLSAHTVSGDVKLKLPENNGFELNFDTISGKSYNEAFEMLGNRHKDGDCVINIDTTSGSLRIEKISASG